MSITARLIAFFILSSSPLQAQLTLKALQATAWPDTAKRVAFRVSGAFSGEVQYNLRLADRPDMPFLESGTVATVNGEAVIEFQPAFPCFVHCQVSAAGQFADAATGFLQNKIEASDSPPDDFEAFWDAQKAQLAQIPMNVELSLLSQQTYFSAYTIRFPLTDGRYAYGYLCVPVGAGPFPAIVKFPSYGFSPGIVQPPNAMAERGGAIALSLNIHDNPPTQQGPADYLTLGAQSPETHYYKYAVLSAVRAIDYLHTRPDFNGQVGIMGISQGGGLAMLAAGIDQRVSAVAAVAAALCDHAGLKFGKPSGFPFYYALGGDALLGPARYYDAAHAARTFNGASFTTLGFEDEICPPATSAAAYNALRGQQVRLHLPEFKHNPTPEEYANPNHPNGVYAFFRTHFPKMQAAPWPWSEKPTGHSLSVAPTGPIHVGDTVQLSAIVAQNGQDRSDWPVFWEKSEDSGNVWIENAFDGQTRAVFSSPGSYRLRVAAFDEDYGKANPDRYYTIRQDVWVQVLEKDAPLNVILTTDSSFVGDTFLIQLTFDRPIEGLEADDFQCARCEPLTILKTSESAFDVRFRAVSKGRLSVQLKESAVVDASGQHNGASNIVELRYSPPLKLWDDE